MALNINNIVNISISESQRGIGAYNTSNLALFPKMATMSNSFGTDGFKRYLDPTEVETDWGSDSIEFKMANAIFSQQPNILAGRGNLVIIQPAVANEKLGAAITRTKDLVQYFGILPTSIIPQDEGLEAAAIVQPLNKMLGLVSTTDADVAMGGYFDMLRTGGFTKARGLFYKVLVGDETEPASLFSAGYFGRALSTIFTGINTTQTMHLQDLIGVQPNTILTQTLFNEAKAAGADIYADFNVPKTYSNGANGYFDDVYNLLWFEGALDVALFNYLATAATKIPQTEEGIGGMRNAIRQICDIAVGNGFIAPGAWKSPTTFGVQSDFLDNITQAGYYVYSAPLTDQLQSDREARKAPLIQLAIKYKGAVHTASAIININR